MARKPPAEAVSGPRSQYVPPSWQTDPHAPPSPLQCALRDVAALAFAGASPVECAAAYRDLASRFPGHPWLLEYAAQWGPLGDSWMPGGPAPGNLGNYVRRPEFIASLTAAPDEAWFARHGWVAEGR